MHFLEFREKLNQAFSPETAVPGTPPGLPPSAGHCAAVAIIAQSVFGGELVSTHVSGQSHWFNRVYATGPAFDIDFTADQFGGPEVACELAGSLYKEVRVRKFLEVKPETLQRAALLAKRAGITI